MKSLVSILTEKLANATIDESTFGDRRRKLASSIASRAKKTGKSLSNFAKEVAMDDHV